MTAAHMHHEQDVMPVDLFSAVDLPSAAPVVGYRESPPLPVPPSGTRKSDKNSTTSRSSRVTSGSAGE
jgi:hypothetical protein